MSEMDDLKNEFKNETRKMTRNVRGWGPRKPRAKTSLEDAIEEFKKNHPVKPDGSGDILKQTMLETVTGDY